MFCSDDVTLTRSAIDTVTSSATGYCSVLFCSSDLTFVASSITGVSATVGDGGYCGVLACAGALVATNSTIGQNSATNPDATEIWNIDSATLVYVTMVSNTGGGAELFESTEVTSFGSVIAQKGAGPLCDTVLLVSNGYNFADDTSCGFAATGDRQGLGLDPQLGPVGANGGSTLTMLPTLTSPLVDAIPLASCQADGAAGITTDQRGEPRPAMLGCDIGAVELQPAVVPVVLVPAFTG
jgi:hypothetical protein